MITIENVLDLPQGQDFYLRQDNKSALWLYTVQDGVAKLYKTDVVNGIWDTIDCKSQSFNTFEKDVLGLRGNEIGDVSVIVYKHDKSMSILKMPADTNKYVYDDTYRLYWAVDSRKLYMNIAKNWEMIGTLRHELMENIGTLSHDEIEAKLNEIEETLGTINSAVSTLNGMNGDVTIAQGDNVTITKDAATKKLTVTSKDTVTTVNSLQGSVILEAGDNVAITQPTGTNKLRITASGGGGGATKVPYNLSVSTWNSSSRTPRVFGGILTFKQDVEITSINVHDNIANMTDAVLLVYRQVPYNIVNALVTDGSSTSSYYIDVSTAAPSQLIPLSKINNMSIKVNAGEPVVLVLYSPSGFTPSTFSYGGFDTNPLIDKARCMVAANGSTSIFITDGDGANEIYSFSFTANTIVTTAASYSNLIDVPPVSPSIYDDEFAGSILASKWNTLRAANGLVEFINGNIVLSTQLSSENGIAIVQTLPTGDFTVTAKLNEFVGTGDATNTSLILSSNNTDITSLVRFGMSTETNNYCVIQQWNNLSAWSSDIYKSFTTFMRSGYLRVNRTANVYTFYVSVNGYKWIKVFSGSLAITPTYFGLMSGSKNNYISEGTFDWIRVTQ